MRRGRDVRRNEAVRGLGRMRNAVVQHCPAVAGALVDARGRRVNAHRLPIRRRSQGPSRPRVSKSVTKGFRLPGHMNENLEIMRLCSVRMGGSRAFVSDAGHLRLPSGFCCGARWRSISALPPAGTPVNSVSSPRRRAQAQLPGQWQRRQDGRFAAHAGTCTQPGAADPGGSYPASPRARQSSGSSCATAARRARASSSQVWQRWARASPRSHSARESSRGTEPASRRCTTATSSSRARS